MNSLTFEILLQTLLSGILLGGLYALIGTGMTIIMGVMKIISLAHGDLMMIAMYIAFFLFSQFQIDPYLSVFIVTPILFFLGMAIQKFLINPTFQIDSILPDKQILLTVGIGMVLTNLATILFTSDFQTTPVSYRTKAFYLSDILERSPIELSLSFPWLISFLFTVAITSGLFIFLTKTDTGKCIRATAQDAEAALLLGVNINRIRMITFGLGTALVGAAGCLFIPMYYIYPDIGEHFTLIAFVITIIGGLGSIMGAIIGGLILGTFETLCATYLSIDWAPICRFVIFIATLIFLPKGIESLFRKKNFGHETLSFSR